MDKNSIKILILSILVLVLAGGLVFEIYKKPANAPTNQNNNQTNNLETYKNGTYNFQFQYPPEFYFVAPAGYSNLGQDSEQIVQIQSDNKNFPGTNLADYAFTVSNQYNYADCLKSVNNKTPLMQTKQINGIIFYQDATTGAAAGNLYDAQIYRTVRDNWCYELTLTVHTGNIANYPEGTVTEVDKNKVFDILNQVLATFKFTP